MMSTHCQQITCLSWPNVTVKKKTSNLNMTLKVHPGQTTTMFIFVFRLRLVENLLHLFMFLLSFEFILLFTHRSKVYPEISHKTASTTTNSLIFFFFVPF